ncbi:adenine phosphoribosyltransferase, partial [Candidatus Gracilibacteria bacterium]|nr:adenine phosphoribosyltransferase [Candidatus Gracilibacteria bacterium]
MDLKKYISEVENFPKKGINFKDISIILENPKILKFVIQSFKEKIGNPHKI